MIDTRSMATMGLYPDIFSTFNVATLGHLQIEITISPYVPTYGGGGLYPRTQRYRIDIVVKSPGSSAEKKNSFVVDRATAEDISVLCGLESFKEDDIMVSAFNLGQTDERVQAVIELLNTEYNDGELT